MKTRIFPEDNYKAIYFNGKTIRIAIDPTKPIKELKYPEFYDIRVTKNVSEIVIIVIWIANQMIFMGKILFKR